MTESDANIDEASEAKEMEEFWRLADSFIHLANEHCEGMEREKVSSAFVYAAARFNAFIVASNAYNDKEFSEQLDDAKSFFNDQYSKMLDENLEDYSENYQQYMDAPLN